MRKTKVELVKKLINVSFALASAIIAAFGFLTPLVFYNNPNAVDNEVMVSLTGIGIGLCAATAMFLQAIIDIEEKLEDKLED